MTKYIITTESGSDLPQDLINKYDIHIVPMHVTMGGETYPDRSFDVQEIFDYYDETEQLPQTSGTTPQDNTIVFEEVFEKYPDAHIIHIAYSAATTVSFNSANIAAQDFENIHFVDAKHVSFGLIAIIKKTVEYIEEYPDVTPEEIIKYVENLRDRTQMVFLPKTLLYLKAGGRVSNLVFHSAKLLRIHPTIVLDDGLLVSGKKYRGSYERCLSRMINNFFKTYNIDPSTIVVGGAYGLEQQYKDQVYQLLGENNMPTNTDKWITPGAVITSHGDPGAIGIAGIEIE